MESCAIRELDRLVGRQAGRQAGPHKQAHKHTYCIPVRSLVRGRGPIIGYHDKKLL